MNTNPFSGYTYNPQNAMTGYKKQLQEQGMNTDFYNEFGKGFVPGSPEPQPVSKYLTFTANENGSSVGFAQFYMETPVEYNIQYKTSNTDWTDYTVGREEDDNVVMIELDEGESVMFKGINPNGFYNPEADEGVYCIIDGSVAASGDITSLLNGVGGDYALPVGCFSYFFSECEGLTTAPELPSTTLANYCYSNMFQDCTGLTAAPELPSTTLADYCYSYMFKNCTSLTTAPELSATTLAEGCYEGMFDGCNGLTTAPELPATTLADSCYSYMFQNCVGLTTAPVLPATTLIARCYDGMFVDCEGLEHVEALFLTNPEVIIPDEGGGRPHYEYPYTMDWLIGVAQEGTFVVNADATWVDNLVNRNNSTIPLEWTIETAAE